MQAGPEPLEKKRREGWACSEAEPSPKAKKQSSQSSGSGRLPLQDTQRGPSKCMCSRGHICPREPLLKASASAQQQNAVGSSEDTSRGGKADTGFEDCYGFQNPEGGASYASSRRGGSGFPAARCPRPLVSETRSQTAPPPAAQRTASRSKSKVTSGPPNN